MASTLTLPRFEIVRGITPRHPLLLPLLDWFSFEGLVALFVFAPRYKAHPLIQSLIPVDPILLFFGLTVLVAPLIVLRRGIYMPGLVLFGGVMLFVFWMLITTAWSPSHGFARDKFFIFLVVGVWTLFCTGIVIAGDRERVARFLRLWIYLTAWLATEVFLQWAGQGYRGRVFIFVTESYLGYGNVCGPAVLILLAYWASQRRMLSFLSLATMALILWLAIPLVIGGGRGPLISTMIAMSVILLIGLDTSHGRIGIYRLQVPIVLVAVAALIFVGWAVSTNLDIETIRRLGRLTGDDIGESAEDRVRQLTRAYLLITMRPITGWGLAAYGALVFDRDENLYPHNLFVELMLETGVVGVILFFLPWWVALRRISIRRILDDRLFLSALLLFVHAFSSLQTSFTYTENRSIMVGLGLLMVRSLSPELETFRPLAFAQRLRMPKPWRTRSGSSAADPSWMRGSRNSPKPRPRPRNPTPIARGAGRASGGRSGGRRPSRKS